ncbi:hypothetical protein [Streptomyces rubrogriseus]|uniref:hypothetical protein n=1 Tax=Streptomyces rubrogriseus TaxID=194673 RepID=UPI0037D6CA30
MLRTGLPVDRAFDDVTAVFGEGADPAEDDIPVLVERPFRLGAAAYRPRDEDLAHDLIAHIAT